MGLVTETNEEYYAGEKVFLVANGDTIQELQTTFNTELILASPNNNANFIVQYSNDIGNTWQNYNGTISLATTKTSNDTVLLNPSITGAQNGTLVKVLLTITSVWNKLITMSKNFLNYSNACGLISHRMHLNGRIQHPNRESPLIIIPGHDAR